MRFEVQVKNRVIVWNLNHEFREMLKPMAASFGWSVEDFLRRYSRNELPAQVPWHTDDDDDDQPKTPKGFTAAAFMSSDREMWERIKRAAVLDNKAPADYIWDCIVAAVCSDEESMVLAPDGRVIGDQFYIRKFEIQGSEI
ncbi:MAG TPA: hypothetical protein VGI60_01120 [Chthoniobacterales bacterium]|jgi:hypothetical protein